MEDQIRSEFSGESESSVNRSDANLERNASADDGNMLISNKKKRGRPRKYAAVDRENSPQRCLSSSAHSRVISKRHVGPPPDAGRLQVLASSGGFVGDIADGSLIPHTLRIAVGEDIVNTISTFSSKGPGTICIMSAVGSLSTVDILHPTGCVWRHQGMFEILRLSVSFMWEMNRRQRHISIILAKPDGEIFGGQVASSLIAGTPVQIIVGSFMQKLSSTQLTGLHTPGHNSKPPGTVKEEICDE